AGTGEMLRQCDVGVVARRLAAGKENERKMSARERRIAMCCGWQREHAFVRFFCVRHQLMEIGQPTLRVHFVELFVEGLEVSRSVVMEVLTVRHSWRRRSGRGIPNADANRTIRRRRPRVTMIARIHHAKTDVVLSRPEVVPER